MDAVINDDVLAWCIFRKGHATVALQTMASDTSHPCVVSLRQQLNNIDWEAVDRKNAGLSQNIMKL
ncbi:protein of unknown function [Cyanobium sp. NIES-981]|nr:protein of unknown function [Cyanobium sp. NIES-981]